jgi:hypothetical protein
MSTTSDFGLLEAKIKAIQAKDVMNPDIPVDVANTEAETLYNVALADKKALIARGLSEEAINGLPTAAGACRYTEALWNKERDAKQEAEINWKEQSPEAFALRDELVDEFDFAFAGNSSLQTILNRIKDDTGNADMIQDLMDLSVLGKDNKKILAQTRFDATKLDKAEELADTMAKLLGIANGTKDDNNAAKLLRDQAYTYMKLQVEEVRRYGKFVFRADKEHVAKYASEYKRS